MSSVNFPIKVMFRINFAQKVFKLIDLSIEEKYLLIECPQNHPKEGRLLNRHSDEIWKENVDRKAKEQAKIYKTDFSSECIGKTYNNTRSDEINVIMNFLMDQYEVEQILDKKTNPKTSEPMFLVKWRNYSQAESTWQPFSHLINCQESIQEYQRKYRLLSKQHQEIDSDDLIPRRKLIKKKFKKLKKCSEKRVKDDVDSSDGEQQKEEKEMDITHSSSPPNEKMITKKQIAVLGMKNVGTSWEFCLQVEEMLSWKKHKEMLEEYPRELCLFYEQHIMFQGL